MLDAGQEEYQDQQSAIEADERARRRTRAVGSFPDTKSHMMLVMSGSAGCRRRDGRRSATWTSNS